MERLNEAAADDALPLRGMRVVDLTRRLSGPYCTMLLATLGAEVVKIEQPGGDPMRRRGPFVGQLSVPFAAVNRGKQSVEIDLKTEAGKERLTALLAGADVLVENFSPGVMARLGFTADVLADINSSLIHCSMSAFGQAHPGRADDSSIQALSGLMLCTGEPGAPPVRTAPPIAAISHAIYAAIGIVAAFHARGSSGGGAHLDIAMLDSLASVMEYPFMYVGVANTLPPRAASQHPTATPSQAFSGRDGPLVIMAASDSEFKRLALALGEPGLAEDPRFRTNDSRTDNRSALTAEIERLLHARNVTDWFEELSAKGVACAPVNSVRQALNLPDIAGRGFVRCIGDKAGIRLTCPPIGPRTEHSPCWRPELGGTPAWIDSPRSGRGHNNSAALLPGSLLKGVKVLDLTRFLAGPFCTMILADMGAGVIKVEPPGGDPTRAFRPKQLSEMARSGYFASINRGKRSVALDLKSPADLQVLEQLIAEADVLVENYRPGVMKRLGLSDDRLRVLNPRLVHASLSGFGQNGRFADRAAFDMTIQAISGMMSLNGAPGSGPVRAGVSVGDIMTGLYAAVAVTAAIGKKSPQRLDISMLECQLALLHGFADAELAGDPLPVKTGAMHGSATPLGAFKAHDGYVHVSAANDQDFSKLCSVLGVSELASSVLFATAEARRSRREELHGLLDRAFGARGCGDWLRILSAQGLIAAPVRNVREALASVEFSRRGVVQQTSEVEPFTLVVSPIRFAGLEPCTPRAAPALNEAHAEVMEMLRRQSGEERKAYWNEMAARA